MYNQIRKFIFSSPKRSFFDSVPFAFAWRYLCHSIMVFMNIIGEGIAAPTLHDRIISIVPFIPIIAKYNYHIWVLCYIPIAALLWRTDRNRFVEFLYAGGVVSLLRGICIFVTNLGPVNGRDVNAGKGSAELIAGWIQIINPFSALTTDAVHVYLTKDLFFSGHTASTFLLLLYTWKYPKLRVPAIVGHILVVGVVFVSHLHYTIDVIGGWSVSFCVFIAAEKFFNRRSRSIPSSQTSTI